MTSTLKSIVAFLLLLFVNAAADSEIGSTLQPTQRANLSYDPHANEIHKDGSPSSPMCMETITQYLREDDHDVSTCKQVASAYRANKEDAKLRILVEMCMASGAVVCEDSEGHAVAQGAVSLLHVNTESGNKCFALLPGHFFYENGTRRLKEIENCSLYSGYEKDPEYNTKYRGNSEDFACHVVHAELDRESRFSKVTFDDVKENLYYSYNGNVSGWRDNALLSLDERVCTSKKVPLHDVEELRPRNDYEGCDFLTSVSLSGVKLIDWNQYSRIDPAAIPFKPVEEVPGNYVLRHHFVTVFGTSGGLVLTLCSGDEQPKPVMMQTGVMLDTSQKFTTSFGGTVSADIIHNPALIQGYGMSVYSMIKEYEAKSAAQMPTQDSHE